MWHTHRTVPNQSCWCEIWYGEMRFDAYWDAERYWYVDGKRWDRFDGPEYRSFFWRIKEQDNG